MENRISGIAHLFGDNIDTDQIFPGRYLELTDPVQIASHCLEGADPRFQSRFHPRDLIVAGKNFGCGSSREQAAVALKALGAGAVVAKSFARIFYRNGINMGLPLIVCPLLDDVVTPGASLTVDLEQGRLYNGETGQWAEIEKISDYAMEILRAGGIKPMLRGEGGK